MPNEETTLIKSRRPSVVKIQEEEQIQVPAGFDFFLKIIEWAPLWCFLLIDNAVYAYTAAFAVTVFDVMFLTYVQHKMGKIRVWPKPLDIIFLTVFGLFTILAWIYQESAETIELYSSAAISAGLALGFFVSWLLGRPAVNGYVVEKFGEEKASHPVMVHMASRLSVMWTIVFSSVAVISGIWPESYWSFFICNLIVGGAFITASHFYPAYVKKDPDVIAALYEDEIAEWEAKYPELNFDEELA
jgi:hypothetical protein